MNRMAFPSKKEDMNQLRNMCSVTQDSRAKNKGWNTVSKDRSKQPVFNERVKLGYMALANGARWQLTETVSLPK